MATITDIEKFIESFNKSWMNGDLAIIEDLLDPDVVFVSPDSRNEIQGKAACIQTFQDYLEMAKTTDFKVVDKAIHRWDQTIMITLEYNVEYQIKQNKFKEKGKEFWLLTERDRKLQMIWRALVDNESLT